MTLATAAVLIGEVSVIMGVLIPVIVYIKKLTNGSKCQLRSDMLRIYYANKKDKTIHQFEYENFALLYDAYKALKGNSFIDKVWKEVQGWDIDGREDNEP